MNRTRIKICGLTRAEDVDAAVSLGADALGFVCYPGSPRHVTPDRLQRLTQRVPAYVTPVLLFVNASLAQVREAAEAVPHALLQLHGDETPEQCATYARPYVKAFAMTGRAALLDCETRYSTAVALLADTPSAAYGGSGTTFDWATVPGRTERRKALILAGGLDADNVADAVRRTRPYAVDVSSGVEAAKGVKSAAKIERFIAAVRAADASDS
jgi:phosphoribosylanthranilate isomerase